MSKSPTSRTRHVVNAANCLKTGFSGNGKLKNYGFTVIVCYCYWCETVIQVFTREHFYAAWSTRDYVIVNVLYNARGCNPRPDTVLARQKTLQSTFYVSQKF